MILTFERKITKFSGPGVDLKPDATKISGPGVDLKPGRPDARYLSY